MKRNTRIMKQSSSSAGAYFHDLTMTVNEAEFEAAITLLELPHLIHKSESRPRFSFTWGAKRRRSSAAETTTQTLSSSSPPTVPETTVAAAAAAAAAVGPASTCETMTEKEKPKVLSPATPLLFSPSESDEKSKPQNSKRRVNFKKKKEEYLKMIEELTERNKIFKEELKNFQSYYDKEKALNLKLKAMINHCLQMEQPQQTQLSLNHALELSQPTVQFEIQGQPQQSQYMVHRQPSIMDQTHRNSKNSQYPHGQNLSLSSNSGLFVINDNKVGPSVPLDLNLSLEESFMIEFSEGCNVTGANKSEIKALAAQARQRRIQICRSKNCNAASKVRYPVRR